MEAYRGGYRGIVKFRAACSDLHADNLAVFFGMLFVAIGPDVDRHGAR